MNYIIMDLEWNQPVGRGSMITKPVPVYGEIIRIGAVKLNGELKEISRHHGCVIPKVYKTMNSSVGRVTGLQSRAITYGLKFPAAFGHFMKWCGSGGEGFTGDKIAGENFAGEDFTILTWGEEDEKILRSNMIFHGMDMNCLPKFYNLQIIFDELIAKSDRQYGLAAALEYYGLPADLKAHDALNDAVYTARIGVKMNFPEYLSGYDALIEKLERQKIERAQKNVKVFAGLENADNAFTGKKYILCRCPGCKKIMRRGAFYYDTPDSVVTRAVCTSDGEYMVRVERSANGDGTYNVTRTVVKMNEEYREICRIAEEKGMRPVSEKNSQGEEESD